MTFTVTICCDNAAFGDDDASQRSHELARILMRLANRLSAGRKPTVMDANGNSVGTVVYGEDDHVV
jgi:hypothetical protein